ncbi:MAG TPA: ABC transporter permease [Bosea sp. (in: a-proteobacteria)]|jgi:peptide/nickel transport system permease protein|nr:ABC transporter permease [Bosea sp. (in: a-proteobacteria)]
MKGILHLWRRYRRNRGAVLGLVVLAAIVLAALFGPMIYTVDPFDMIGRPAQAPSARFPLGTDVTGRDMLAGLLHGARVSLLIGVAASVCATVIGVAVGAAAGYWGKTVDAVLMRLTDFFLTIPSFVLAVVIIAIFRPSLVSVMSAIAIVSWPPVARLARAEFMAHRDREYVQACRAMGMSDWRIAVRQILPNALPPVIVVSSLLVATAILTESGLSFLGLADPNVVSWGYMIGVGRTLLRTAWWMSAIPGIAILVTVLCINLVGEGLSDALNPKLQER